MDKRAYFRHPILPYLLVLPQLVVTAIFFLWPAGEALKGSFFRGDAFGLHHRFVWFDNFKELFTSPQYLQPFTVTIVFSVLVTVLALSSALLMASMANRVIRGN